ncbi:hypothetical protein TTHERM_00415810 (macronuclear) [Tetrahymena thermophila SB210]|uniref:Uncharacterized protein n=1 Tax=Tetrahymena thermophila (strain SB210) TaxID=312017 RepID=Q22P14_TETTS|nr:hypothetical protein TTHERM_00415810 [Tetrahymena thermophila SB210]EAR86997.2 hypothetical protein TTHERM_00415810 [Tetrahymena thermophila SB210]|eukprot:XP_001007242.2 hypothetical protein TTHERM_00415810 [Tetrahymena thermophila SB210]
MHKWKHKISRLYKLNNKIMKIDISDVHEASQALLGISQELTNCGKLEQILLNVCVDYSEQQYEDLGKAIKQCKMINLFINNPFHTPNLKKFIKQISYLNKVELLELYLQQNWYNKNLSLYFENLQEIAKLSNLKTLIISLNNSREFINMKSDVKKIQQFGDQISNLKNLIYIKIDFGPINTYNKYSGVELDNQIILPLRSFFIKNKKIILIKISYNRFDPYEGSTYE